MSSDETEETVDNASTLPTGTVGRDPKTGKFRPPVYRNPDVTLSVVQQRHGELWMATDSLDARARHISALVATTCLLPFLVASNFPAAGAFRLVQGLFLAFTSGCSLSLVWLGLRAVEPMDWEALGSTDDLLRHGAGCQTAPDVTVGVLKDMRALDMARTTALEAQADKTDRIHRFGRTALLVQAATAGAILALGFFGR